MLDRQKPQIRPDKIGTAYAGYVGGMAMLTIFGMRERYNHDGQDLIFCKSNLLIINAGNDINFKETKFIIYQNTFNPIANCYNKSAGSYDYANFDTAAICIFLTKPLKFLIVHAYKNGASVTIRMVASYILILIY